MASKRERDLLGLLGNASRGVALVSQSIGTVLLLFGDDGGPLRREDLRPLGRDLVSLAGVLTDLGVQMATNNAKGESDNSSPTSPKRQ
jgi:hypothetical protein